MKVLNFQKSVEPGSSPHDAELTVLRQLYDDVRSTARGRAVILHGPRGSGADSLLTMFKRELHRRRDHVFETDCLPGAAVYAPLTDIVSRWVRAADDLGVLGEAFGELYSEVGHSLGIPRLSALTPVDRPVSPSGQIQFYERLGRLFTELSAVLPCVLIIRDLHVADSATRAAVTYMIQNVVTDPVGSFAPDGLGTGAFNGQLLVTVASESGVARSLQRTLSDRDRASFIDLSAVTQETVRRFLSSDEVVERFVASSGGVADNLRALIDTIPEKVEDLFLRRCEQLEPSEIEILGALAVLGKPVPPDFLLRVLEGAADGTQLSSLFEQRVVTRRVFRGQLLVDLPTEDNRKLLYQRLQPALRTQLHGRIARLIEERARFGEPADLTELAEHFLRSVDDAKAVEYSLAAAERLHISFAHERAIELLESALPKVTGTTTRSKVLDRLIDLHKCLSEHKRALFYLGHLKREMDPHSRGPLYRRVGEMLLELGHYHRALRILDRARTLVPPDDLHERVRIDAVAAEAYYGCGQYDRVVEVCRKRLGKLVNAKEADAHRMVMRLTNTLGKVYLFREDFGRAKHAFEENLKRADENSWPEEAVRARFNLGTILLQRRRYDEAESVFTACLAVACTASNPIIRAFCLMNLGVVYHKTHRYDQALDAYLHGLATFKKSGNELQFAVVAMNLAALYQSIGDLKRARALIETSLAVSEAQDIQFYQGWGSYVIGGIALDEGDYDQAVTALERAESTMQSLGSLHWVDRIRARRAHLAVQRGDLDDADDLLASLQLDSKVRETREIEGHGRLWLGHVQLAREDFEAAVESLRTARTCFSEIGDRERIWFTDLLLGETLQHQKQRRQAREHLESAVEEISAIGEHVPEALSAAYAASPNRARAVQSLDKLRQIRRAPTPSRQLLAVPAPNDFDAWRARYDRIVGHDPRLLQIFRMVDRIANSDSTVLVQGESGTGKELIAEAIHKNSSRKDRPFIKVNCAAFVETLLLSELFGHEKGAFTGALNRKKGRFELAHGGTLFLDEIGDISSNTQVALLRVLQERTFERVGGSDVIDVDVRIVVATNRNLEQLVRRGDFRLDLYYRLKGVILELPPLRDRRPDVVRLLRHFMKKFVPSNRPQELSRSALDFLARYSWPGNVRELENFTRSLTLFVDDSVIEIEHIMQFEDFFADGEILDELPADFFDALDQPSRALPRVQTAAIDADDRSADVVELPANGTDADPGDVLMAWAQSEGLGLPELRRRLEVECIKRALLQTGGNITKAARVLEMKRPRLSQIINATDELAALKKELVS